MLFSIQSTQQIYCLVQNSQSTQPVNCLILTKKFTIKTTTKTKSPNRHVRSRKLMSNETKDWFETSFMLFGQKIDQASATVDVITYKAV